MSIATLADIIAKVRRLTVTSNSSQLTDSQIIDYINSYYLYDFPAEFRSLKLKDKYTFNTQKGVDTYPFDSEHYTTVEQPVFCQKRMIPLYQQPSGFFGLNFNWQQSQVLTQGNGGVGPYTGTCQNTPLLRSTNNNPAVQTTLTATANFLTTPSQPSFPNTNISRVQNLLITANVSNGTTLNVTDDGAGNLIGTTGTSGTINYDTGAISVTFPSAVPSGEDITIQYNPVSLSIPLSIMFFQNQFTLRPVPDKGYIVELVAYRLPSQVLLGTTDPNNPNYTGYPEQREWWEVLAFGCAKKVYQDRIDMEGVAMMDIGLKEAMSKAQTRTYAQLGKQSTNTIFQGQTASNYTSGTGWGVGSGN